jgi:hypothetical protein
VISVETNNYRNVYNVRKFTEIPSVQNKVSEAKLWAAK